MKLTFDLSDFNRQAKRMGALADQVPFALASALNDAAEATRKELITNTWPSHVQVRNKSFLGAALTTKGERATKKKLSVAIYDKLGRASLKQHADGGTKKPKGAALAIPSDGVKAKRTGKGVPKRLRPLALPRSFKKGDSIFQRPVKPGGKLKLMYTLKPSASISADVPFEEDFTSTMRREVSGGFAQRLRAAMNTRRPKR